MIPLTTLYDEYTIQQIDRTRKTHLSLYSSFPTKVGVGTKRCFYFPVFYGIRE